MIVNKLRDILLTGKIIFILQFNTNFYENL